MIRQYFNQEELKQLITSNFYKILYYNAEIWMIPSLKSSLKQKILSESSAALRLHGKSDWSTSYEQIHLIYNRAAPQQMMKYKHCLELFTLNNGNDDRDDWMDLNFQQNHNNRNEFFNAVDSFISFQVVYLVLCKFN